MMTLFTCISCCAWAWAFVTMPPLKLRTGVGVGGGDDVPAAFHREAVRNRQGRSHLAAVGGQREGLFAIVRACAPHCDVSPGNGSGVSHPASRGEGARYGKCGHRHRHHGETHPKSRHPYLPCGHPPLGRRPGWRAPLATLTHLSDDARIAVRRTSADADRVGATFRPNVSSPSGRIVRPSDDVPHAQKLVVNRHAACPRPTR